MGLIPHDDDVVVLPSTCSCLYSFSQFPGEPMNASDVPWAPSIRTVVRHWPLGPAGAAPLVRRKPSRSIRLLGDWDGTLEAQDCRPSGRRPLASFPGQDVGWAWAWEWDGDTQTDGEDLDSPSPAGSSAAPACSRNPRLKWNPIPRLNPTHARLSRRPASVRPRMDGPDYTALGSTIYYLD